MYEYSIYKLFFVTNKWIKKLKPVLPSIWYSNCESYINFNMILFYKYSAQPPDNLNVINLSTHTIDSFLHALQGPVFFIILFTLSC
jgi:hypothetical protein